MQQSWLDGVAPDSNGIVSYSEWLCTEIFNSHLKDHLDPLLPVRSSDSLVVIFFCMMVTRAVHPLLNGHALVKLLVTCTPSEQYRNRPTTLHCCNFC